MERDKSDLRVLVFAPIGRDGPACAEILRRAGRSVHICNDLAALVDEIEAGVVGYLLSFLHSDDSAILAFGINQLNLIDANFAVDPRPVLLRDGGRFH